MNALPIAADSLATDGEEVCLSIALAVGWRASCFGDKNWGLAGPAPSRPRRRGAKCLRWHGNFASMERNPVRAFPRSAEFVCLCRVMVVVTWSAAAVFRSLDDRVSYS